MLVRSGLSPKTWFQGPAHRSSGRTSLLHRHVEREVFTVSEVKALETALKAAREKIARKSAKRADR